jgi:hypothetical protein
MCAAAAVMTRPMGVERRPTHDICGDFHSLLALQAELSRRRSQKPRDANEIVGPGGEHEKPLQQAARAMACSAQATDGLDPTEQFFDAFPLDVLMRWPGCRVELHSIAERRLVLFCETYGVQLRSRQPTTKSAGCFQILLSTRIIKPGDVEGLTSALDRFTEYTHLRQLVGENGKALHQRALTCVYCTLPNL